MIHLTINIRHDIDIHVSGESAYNKRKTGTEREEREREGKSETEERV